MLIYIAIRKQNHFARKWSAKEKCVFEIKVCLKCNMLNLNDDTISCANLTIILRPLLGRAFSLMEPNRHLLK